MGRKQVIVQLDDQLVEELDKLALQENASRSELIRKAALALLEARRVQKLDRQLQEAYRLTPQDPLFTETARRLAAENIPGW